MLYNLELTFKLKRVPNEAIIDFQILGYHRKELLSPDHLVRLAGKSNNYDSGNLQCLREHQYRIAQSLLSLRKNNYELIGSVSFDKEEMGLWFPQGKPEHEDIKMICDAIKHYYTHAEFILD